MSSSHRKDDPSRQNLSIGVLVGHWACLLIEEILRKPVEKKVVYLVSLLGFMYCR